MELSEYDETRATARLPNLDIEFLHRRPWEGNEEQLVVMLRAVPSFEAVGRWLEVSTRCWSGRGCWKRHGRRGCTVSPRHSPRASDHHPCLVLILASMTEQIPERTGSVFHHDRGTERHHPRHPRYAPRCSVLSGTWV